MTGALQAVFMNMRSFLPNFITTQKGAGTTTITGASRTQFSIDSTGNSYYILKYAASNSLTGGGVVSKISTSGTTTLAVSLINTSYYVCCGYNIPDRACGTADYSDNFYLATQIYDASLNGGVNIAKFNSSGTVQWQRKLQDNAVSGHPIQVSIDSSANVYILASVASSGSLGIIKYNSSGTRQWQKSISNSYSAAGAMHVDSSGNIYVLASDSNGSGSYGMLVIKLDTSGTVLGFSDIYKSSVLSTQVLGSAINLDSSGNIYISGQQIISGNYSTLVIKLDSSFVFQWGRYMTGGSVSTPPGAFQLSFDSSNNVYVASGNFTKFNSSGTTQLQRSITEYSLVAELKGIQNYQTNMYFATATSGANGYGGINYALPNDGSKTGTYTVGTSTVVYAASSQTISTYTATTITGRGATANISTLSYVDSAGSGTTNTITTTNVTATV